MSSGRRQGQGSRTLTGAVALLVALSLGAARGGAAESTDSKPSSGNPAEAARAALQRKTAGAMSASSATAEHVTSVSGGAPAKPAPTAAAPTPTARARKAGVKPGTAAAALKSTVPSRTKNEERHLLNREVYVYKTVGRRDPFASLLEGEFETTVGRPLLDVSSMKLVGIVWGTSDKFALVEDGRGHGHVLRVGDPVINGYVVGLTQEEILIRQTSYGESQTVTIQLKRKEGTSP